MVRNRRWRRRNHRQDDEFDSSDNSHDISVRTYKEPVFPGDRHVAGRGGRNNQSRNRNRHHHETSNPFQNNNPLHHATNLFECPFPQSLPVGSKRFKEYLIDSLSQILSQVQRWRPVADEDETMDWQSEAEFVIPQPGEDVNFVWGRVQLPTESVLRDRDGTFMEKDRGNQVPRSWEEKVVSETPLTPPLGQGFSWGPEKATEWETPASGGFQVSRPLGAFGGLNLL